MEQIEPTLTQLNSNVIGFVPSATVNETATSTFTITVLVRLVPLNTGVKYTHRLGLLSILKNNQSIGVRKTF